MTASGGPGVDLDPFALELARSLSTAAGRIDSREGVLVRVTVAGTAGVGEATPLAGWTESLEACRAALERVAGLPPDRALAAVDAGATPAARHGLALAVLDARARSAGRSLSRHLGGGSRTRVPVNATVDDGSPAATADAVREAVAAGFDCVKLKVGARPLAADLDRIERAREAAPDVTIRADANGAWDRETAARALANLAPAGVAYVEQPLPAGDLAGHRELRGGPVGVAVDEGVAEHGVRAVLESRAADVLVVKPMVAGGPDRARSVALAARAAGVTPVVTTTVDAVFARTGAVHLAASLPTTPACGLATADRLAEDLAPDPAPVVGGTIRVPRGPGLGVAAPRR